MHAIDEKLDNLYHRKERIDSRLVNIICMSKFPIVTFEAFKTGDFDSTDTKNLKAYTIVTTTVTLLFYYPT